MATNSHHLGRHDSGWFSGSVYTKNVDVGDGDNLVVIVAASGAQPPASVSVLWREVMPGSGSIRDTEYSGSLATLAPPAAGQASRYCFGPGLTGTNAFNVVLPREVTVVVATSASSPVRITAAVR